MSEFHCHWETLLVLPLVAVCEIGCTDEECLLHHGYGIEIGWLFFTMRIGWPRHAEGHEISWSRDF